MESPDYCRFCLKRSCCVSSCAETIRIRKCKWGPRRSHEKWPCVERWGALMSAAADDCFSPSEHTPNYKKVLVISYIAYPPTMTSLLQANDWVGDATEGIYHLYYTLYSLISISNNTTGIRGGVYLWNILRGYCPVWCTNFGANVLRANALRIHLRKVNEKSVACISTPSCFPSSQLIKFIQYSQQRRDKSRS